MERRRLGLRRFLHQPVEFRGRRLVEPCALLQTQEIGSPREAAKVPIASTSAVYFGALETHRDMRLGAEVVDLVGPDLRQQAGEVRSIGQIPVMQKCNCGLVSCGILVDVVDPLRVER